MSNTIGIVNTPAYCMLLPLLFLTPGFARKVGFGVGLRVCSTWKIVLLPARSRSPARMTERKARANARVKARAKAKAEADTGNISASPSTNSEAVEMTLVAKMTFCHPKP
jgi:hypothetical protein